MNTWLNHWSLALVTFLPLAGMVLMMALPKGEESMQKLVALGTSLLTLATGLWIAFEFNYGGGAKGHGLQFVIDRSWIS